MPDHGTCRAIVAGARCSTLVKRLACVEHGAPAFPPKVLDTSIPTQTVPHKQIFVNFKCREAATASSPFDLLPDRAGQMKKNYFFVFPPKRGLCIHFFCAATQFLLSLLQNLVRRNVPAILLLLIIYNKSGW